MLKTQEFLQQHSLKDLHDRYAIKAIPHPDYPLVSLKYDQIASPRAEQIVRECRGLILDQGNNWNVVSYPFFRFYNYGEGLADPIDWQSAKVYKKEDGCCDENVLLLTKDGTKTIKEVCESKYSGSVSGFDFETEEVTWAEIEGHLIQENNDDWYEVSLENGETINLTGNHQVWIVNENRYKKVKDLTGEETVLLY